jgi:hypothetical protein
MQFGMHAALGQSNQAAFPPFFNRRLDAVRCALRSVASTETVLLSGACSASPIMIRANTTISLPLIGNTSAACVRGGASIDYTVSSAAHTRQVHHTSVDGAPPVHALIRPLDVSSGQRPETSCTPLRLMNIMPLSTRRSFTRARPRLFGNYGRSRCICASASQYKLRMISSNNWGI